MSYRDPSLALTARRDSLRDRLRDFPDDAEAQLALAEVIADIEREARRTAKPRLATSKCPARFEGMTGGDVARRCALCSRTVYDLRGLTTQEAEAHLAENGDRGRTLWRRSDGTVRVGDCAVGRRRSNRRALCGLFAIAAVFALGLVFSVSAPPPPLFIERVVPACPAPEPEPLSGAFDGEAFLHGPPPPPERVGCPMLTYCVVGPLVGALGGPKPMVLHADATGRGARRPTRAAPRTKASAFGSRADE